MSTYYSNGKLLLTGEYLVIDGATSLALPTKFGQSLHITPIDEPAAIWESFDEKNNLWFQAIFDIPKLRIISETFDSNIEGGDDSLALKLQKILFEIRAINPEFLTSKSGFQIKSTLNFPRDWGLGTSSTLINNLAQWAHINAFELQFKTFGGSAYDIACAQNNTPILYHLKEKTPVIKTVDFNPQFKKQLFFVHLNKKQNSREGIALYKNFKGNIEAFLEEISRLTNEIIQVTTISDFEKILAEHEQVISSILKQEPIQKKLFSDYFGQTKSLGAWGGDFILATGNVDTPKYFKNKGFHTILPYEEMIL